MEMETIIANSFRNFHAKGLDYICLARSKDITVKAYFFEGDLINAAEIVHPHDHRYDFSTEVLWGSVRNKVWTETTERPDAIPFHRFSYHTPLNGGNGFTWDRQTWLKLSTRALYARMGRYTSGYDAVHTLEDVTRGTVLLLWQYRDVLPDHVPSHTYGRDREPPSLSGLYDKHTPDQIRFRLRQLETLRPGICSYYGVAA